MTPSRTTAFVASFSFVRLGGAASTFEEGALAMEEYAAPGAASSAAAPPTSTSARASSDTAPLDLFRECGICMVAYDAEDNYPYMCATNFHPLCLACVLRVDKACPSCRKTAGFTPNFAKARELGLGVKEDMADHGTTETDRTPKRARQEAVMRDRPQLEYSRREDGEPEGGVIPQQEFLHEHELQLLQQLEDITQGTTYPAAHRTETGSAREVSSVAARMRQGGLHGPYPEAPIPHGTTPNGRLLPPPTGDAMPRLVQQSRVPETDPQDAITPPQLATVLQVFSRPYVACRTPGERTQVAWGFLSPGIGASITRSELTLRRQHAIDHRIVVRRQSSDSQAERMLSQFIYAAYVILHYGNAPGLGPSANSYHSTGNEDGNEVFVRPPPLGLQEPLASTPSERAPELQTTNELKLAQHPLFMSTLHPLLQEGNTTFEFFACGASGYEIGISLARLACDLVQRIGGSAPCHLLVVARSTREAESVIRYVSFALTGNLAVFVSRCDSMRLVFRMPGERRTREITSIDANNPDRRRGLSATHVVILE